MKVVRLLWTFYLSYALFSLLVTLASIGILYRWGIGTFQALFWFKVATLVVTVYHINTARYEAFYYYKNLGLTKRCLWSGTLVFDFVLFLLLMMITQQIR